MHIKAWIVAALAAAALGGIALAADAQHETFLRSSDLDAGLRGTDLVSGNLVALTGLIVAAALTAAAACLAKVPWRQRVGPLVAVFFSAYILVLVVQTAMFNHHKRAVGDGQTFLDLGGSFSVSPVILNLPAAPSVFLGPMSLALAAGLGLAVGGRILLGSAGRVADLTRATHAAWGSMLLVAPFLVVLVAGDLYVLVDLPVGDPATLPYLVLMPLAALAAGVLMVGGAVKTHQLAQAANEPRLAPVALESWAAVRRVEWAAAGALLGAAVLGTLLEPIVMEDTLEAGRVFGLTAKSHMQSHAAPLVLLVPWWVLHGQVTRRLADPVAGEGVAGWESFAFMGALVLGTVLSILLTFLVAGALWPWLGVAAVTALFALVVLTPQESLLPAMVCALVLWGIGNTVVGEISLATDFEVSYDTSAGLLAVGRAAAVLTVAWAVTRSMRSLADEMPRSLAWPMTLGAGAAVAIILFLELPYSAWIQRDGGGQAVAIGTVVASQDLPVRIVMHSIAVIAAGAAGLAVSRLHRPDWFRGGAGPTPVETPLPRMPESSAD